MELKDEDIKKALECCFEWHCTKCPMVGKYLCSKSLREHALDLINQQQAEIERLQWEKDHFEFKVDDLNGKLEKFKEYRDIKNGAYEREIEKLQAVIDDLKRDTVPKLQDSLNRANKYGIELERENARLKTVIDDLKHEIRNLECEKGQLEGTIDFLVAEAKSEAIKEFAERLKKEAVTKCDWDNCVDVEDFDRLVAEMVGGENA